MTLSMMLASSGYAHELNFGFFDLYERGNSFYMEIRLDKQYTMKALGISENVQQVESISCELTSYIDDNLSLTLNNREVSLEYFDFSANDDIVIIQAKMNVPYQSVSEIKIFNTVLLSTVANQNNIIKVPFHQKNRSFRLNAKRTSTTIKY